MEQDKIKKKRKVNDENLEISPKKKKLRNQQPTDLHTEEITDRENHGEIREEFDQSRGNKKEKKKKRQKDEEHEKNNTIDVKAKINGVSENDEMQSEKETNSQVEEFQIEENSDNEEMKMSNKEANQLSAKSLRKSFNSNEGMETLRKFLAIVKGNKERDLTGEYLQAGGSVLEVLRLLDTSDKKNIGNAASVFSAIHLIIIKILAKFPQHQSNAEEACRHFINSHLSFVHSMLSSQSNAKHRKIVLRLLASMVSLGGSLPRELLGHLSFHSQVIETLSQHTKPTDSQSVRTCYIHFVLAFLIEGNGSIIRSLLDKRGMLSSIFPGLIYDSHQTVHLVLETVKTWILENPAISKTSKLHVFSTPVLQSLVSLYNWKGPKNWPGPKGNRGERKDVVDPVEKEIAVEAVHNFLTTLLTSNRYGVIFHDRTLGTSGRKHNQLVNTVLQSLDRPWEHSKPSELVVKILVACPDLVRSQLAYAEPFLEPRASKKWIMVMRFLGKLFDSLDPENCLKSCLTEISISQVANAVQSLTIPHVVLKTAIGPSLSNANLMIRHEGIVLLSNMLKKTSSFSRVVENNWEAADYLFFKNSIIDYISKNVPSLESILKVWNCALEPEEKTEVTEEDIQEFIPKKYEHFGTILDLLEAYREICPERMDLTNCGDEASEILLKGLDVLCMQSEETSMTPETEMSEIYKMKVKALKFLLFVDIAAFAPKKPLFGRTLVFLLSTLDHEEMASHCHETVRMLLSTSGMFEGCDEQIDFWLKSLSCFDNQEEKLEAINWFVKIVQQAIKKTDKYLDIVVEAEESAGEQIFNGGRFEDVFDNLYEKDSESIEHEPGKIAPMISISPIFCSAIESLKKNSSEILTKYVSHVSVLTLHCQVSPGTFIHLTENANLPAKKYLKSWLAEENPISLKKSLTTLSIFSKLSKTLLSDDALNFEEIFEGSKHVEFRNEEKNYSISHDLNEYEVSVLFRMSTFYLTQFMQRGDLTQDRFDKYKLCTIALLHIAKNLNDDLLETCSRMFFAHPTVLSYFSPNDKTIDVVEKILTAGFLNICKVVVDLNRNEIIPSLFLPFKNKMISHLELVVKKCKEDKTGKKALFLVDFLEILRPTTEDVIKLLSITVELPLIYFMVSDKNKSMSGNLVTRLLDILTEKGPSDVTIDVEVVKKMCAIFMNPKICIPQLLHSWAGSLYRYLESCPRNIAGIDAQSFNVLLRQSTFISTEMTPAMNLLMLVVSRNDQFVPLFVKFATNSPTLLQNHNLIFSIIERRLDYSWSELFLKTVYERSRNEILDYFEGKTEKTNWIPQNVKATSFIINSCFGMEDCQKVCEFILSSGDKLENVELSFVQLVESVFKKYSELKKSEEPLTQFVQVLIRVMVSILKKGSKNEEKLEKVSKSVRDAIEALKSARKDFSYEELSKNYSWPQFTRFSLKLGLKAPKGEEKGNSMLKTLVAVCDVAYKDASEDDYVKTLFEMTTSHSEFVNIMLSSQKIKRDLLELLFVLVRKNQSLMLSSQIPLYLASYNATLEESDQFILLILQHYEAKGIKLNEYKPYLWGEAAATHYSVKGEADTALWRQPSTSQVLELFNPDIVKQTIKNFPVNRDLRPTELHDPAKVYDPSFYLPLLTYLLAENNVVACHKVTQSGALVLALAACGSICEKIRLAAYTVISRFYFHLEATNSKEKRLWIRFLDAFRNGILDTDSSLEEIRISCLVSTFLARAALVTTQPTNKLYSPIQTFLMAKPALELNTIPELLQLFHSSDVEHEAHRHWILQVIRDGLKTHFDMSVALKCVLFKMLMDFYTCVMADPVTKRLILEIIESSVKIPKAGMLLARSYGLLPWLSEISSSLTPRELDRVELVVSIVREILTKINDRDLRFLLLIVLKNLRHCFTKNTSPACFETYTNSLSEILQAKSFRDAVGRKDLEEILDVGRQIYGDIGEVADILHHGREFSSRVEIVEANSDELTVARASLKKLVLTWCGHGQR